MWRWWFAKRRWREFEAMRDEDYALLDGVEYIIEEHWEDEYVDDEYDDEEYA